MTLLDMVEHHPDNEAVLTDQSEGTEDHRNGPLGVITDEEGKRGVHRITPRSLSQHLYLLQMQYQHPEKKKKHHQKH